MVMFFQHYYVPEHIGQKSFQFDAHVLILAATERNADTKLNIFYIFRSIPVQFSGVAVSSQKG